MSFIDDIEIYNDPIISRKRQGTINSPFKQMIETLTVENGKVILTEIPNIKERVLVKNGSTYLMEADDNTNLSANLFFVDYPNGIVYFHNSLSNQSLDFTYLGEGARFFPSSRIWLENDGNKILNAKDKFSDIDRLIEEQKTRVDVQIQSVPQPYEILDMRVDRNGTVYSVAKDRIDAEQLKIDNLKTEVDAAHVDLLNNKYISIKDRLDAEQQEILDTRTDANGNQFTSLSNRFNSIDSDIQAFQQNITSLSDSLSLKVDSTDFTGETIVSKIELTPGNILISANKIDLNGAIGINALDSSVLTTINNAVLKSHINLTDTLPTAIALDNNGITAYTSNPTRFSRMNQNGFYAKNGALTVERSDGYQLISDGIANFDFSVDPHDPPFHDSRVTINQWWYSTTYTDYVDVNYYNYKHNARYLRLMLVGGSDTGGGQHVCVFDADGRTKLWEGFNGTWINDTYTGSGVLDITIDLGVPTGNLRSFYIRMYSISSGVTTYLRVLRKWLEG